MMRASKLDRRISLKQQVGTLDEYGQKVDTWTDIATVWASVLPERGAEKAASGEIKASTSKRFHIRYSAISANINPTWRLVYEGCEYEISQVNEIGRKEEFEILANARAE